MKKFVFYIFVGLIGCANVAFANDLKALRDLLDPVETLTGNFAQHITAKDGEHIQKTEGKFAIKRPGFFLWESEAPYEQTVVGSPEKLWIYDPDLEQLTVRKQSLNDSNSPAKIISGNLDELNKTFNVVKSIEPKAAAEKSTKDETVLFTLTPKDVAQANYQNVQMRFLNNQLKHISFVDKLDQTTKVVFSSVEQNKALAASTFEFVPPVGTDIISDEQ